MYVALNKTIQEVLHWIHSCATIFRLRNHRRSHIGFRLAQPEQVAQPCMRSHIEFRLTQVVQPYYVRWCNHIATIDSGCNHIARSATIYEVPHQIHSGRTIFSRRNHITLRCNHTYMQPYIKGVCAPYVHQRSATAVQPYWQEAQPYWQEVQPYVLELSNQAFQDFQGKYDVMVGANFRALHLARRAETCRF